MTDDYLFVLVVMNAHLGMENIGWEAD